MCEGMIITLHIDEANINNPSGHDAAHFVINEFRRSPAWFLERVDQIEVVGSFGRCSEDVCGTEKTAGLLSARARGE